MFEYLTSNSEWLGPLVLLRAEAALLLLECPLVLQTAWGSYVTTLAPGWTHGGIVHCDHVTILFACSSLFWDDPYWYCMIGHVMYNICILVLESLVLRGIDILKFHGHHWASKISKVRRDKVKSTPFFWGAAYQDAGFWPLSECGTLIPWLPGAWVSRDPRIPWWIMMLT